MAEYRDNIDGYKVAVRQPKGDGLRGSKSRPTIKRETEDGRNLIP